MGFFCDICGALLPPRSQHTYCSHCQKNTARQVLSDSRDIFPFSHIRKGQKEFLKDAEYALKNKEILMAHAPTGIGKTAAALTAAIKEKGTHKIFFLTSKQSHHRIVIETLQKMPSHITATDIISKQHMCPRAESQLPYPVFEKFCSEKGQKHCNLFNRDMSAIVQILQERTRPVEDIMQLCRHHHVCPHKAALLAGRDTDIIICDYNYIFSDIRERIFGIIKTQLENIIIIIDEAHNLPDRIRSHLEEHLSLPLLKDAFTILHENNSWLAGFAKRLSHELSNIAGGETQITQEFLDKKLMQALQGSLDPYKKRDDILEDLEATSRDLLESNPLNSAPLQLFSFLKAWGTTGNSVFRSYTPDPPTITVGLLDPSLYTREVFSRVSGAVLMSGTLHPGDMYADLLGIDNPYIKSYSSPFPRGNRKIVSDRYLTTRYEERTNKMFQEYAQTICNLSRVVPGNIAVFFPSYDLIHEVYEHLAYMNVGRHIIVEDRAYTKAEKEMLVNSLRTSDTHLLMAVQGGSLSEGVDYENNSLSSILIAGMPFPPPSLELEALQDYYSSKFGKQKGYDYTRVYPSLNRVLQAVGRCIRSETDRAFIVLLDKRFNYPKYRQSMPQGFTYHTSVDLIAECTQFFSPHDSS